MVVFVDDLDRCLPKTAISTLESIRLLLFIKRSAFVIAADNDFIKGAVRVHFAGTEIKDEVATNYFDKLIQVPLQVPRLGVNEAKAYIALLLMQRAKEDGVFNPTKFDIARAEVSKRLRDAWRGDAVSLEFLEAQVGVDNQLMVERMKLADGLAPLLTRSIAVNGNPRLIKRFLNTVFLRSSLAEPQGITLDLEALAKWHLVERCAPELAIDLSNLVTSESDGRVAALRSAEESNAARASPCSAVQRSRHICASMARAFSIAWQHGPSSIAASQPRHTNPRLRCGFVDGRWARAARRARCSNDPKRTSNSGNYQRRCSSGRLGDDKGLGTTSAQARLA